MKTKIYATADKYLCIESDDYIMIFGFDARQGNETKNIKTMTYSEWARITGVDATVIQKAFNISGIITSCEKSTGNILIITEDKEMKTITAGEKAMMDDAMKTLDNYQKSLDLGFPEFLSDALLDRYREKRKAIIDNGIPAEMFDEYMITA